MNKNSSPEDTSEEECDTCEFKVPILVAHEMCSLSGDREKCDDALKEFLEEHISAEEFLDKMSELVPETDTGAHQTINSTKEELKRFRAKNG